MEFCTLAAEVGWNEAALRDAFYHGLDDQLKDELAIRGERGSLTEYIRLTISLDNRMRERRRERDRRFREGVCLYCGQPGHVVKHCPVRPKGGGSSVRLGSLMSRPFPSEPVKGFCFQATIAWDTQSWDTEALVDSGAEACFVDQA